MPKLYANDTRSIIDLRVLIAHAWQAMPQATHFQEATFNWNCRVKHQRLQNVDFFSLRIDGHSFMLEANAIRSVVLDKWHGLQLVCDEFLVYFPAKPRHVLFDDLRRIREFVQPEWQFELNDGAFSCVLNMPTTSVGEILFFVIPSEQKSMLDEYLHSEVGDREWAVEGCWTTATGPGLFWDYIILGQVYSGRFARHGRFPSAQTAWSLYKIASVSWLDTQNPLCHFVMAQLAYSVKYEMDNFGTWGNGEWMADFLETHLRFHNDGIHLMLSAYQEFEDESFLISGHRAGHYLLSSRDELGLHRWWFLHDALELSDEHSDLPAKRLLESSRFGKHPNNTLTLNTHLQALIVLHRLHHVTEDADFHHGFEQGWLALEAILAISGSSLPHYFADWVLKLSFERSRANWGRRALRSLLRQHVVKHLTRVQQFAPTVTTPGGYIWRDWELPLYGYWYHLVNLYDLMLVNLIVPNSEMRMRGVIERGVTFSMESGLIDWLVAQDHYIYPQWLQILHAASSLRLSFNEDNPSLTTALARGKEHGYGVPPELFVAPGTFEGILPEVDKIHE